MKRYFPVLVVLLVMLSFSVTALTATRTISGNDVTVTIEPGEELEITLIETLGGGATVVAGSFPRADCGVDAQSVQLTCGSAGAETITFTYQTAGAGTVSGTVDGVDYVDFSPETVVVDGDSNVGVGEAPVAEPAAPAEPAADGDADVPPPPPPPVPDDEPELPIPRAPLTAADLADDANPDGDEFVNVDDPDDDGDGVNDVDADGNPLDICPNTYIGAADVRDVLDNGCLEGDLGGVEDGTPPDGCVNNDDVSADTFLDVLIHPENYGYPPDKGFETGFDALSSLLWGMFDNWNADEVGCQ